MSITFLKGDCLEVMQHIPNNSVDLIICDLPYGCLNNGGITWDMKIDLEVFWKEVRRIRRSSHSPTLHFCTTKFGYDLIKSNEKEFRYDLVWNKQRGVSFLSANKMPMRSHEMIYVFSKAGAFYERKDIEGDFKKWNKDPDSVRIQQVYTNEIKRTVSGGDGKRCPLSVIDVNQKSSFQMKGQHPTEKPKELYKFLIERYCPKNGTVLDPTAGSFNSCRIAKELGYKAIGIEKDSKFFYKAVAYRD